jgi:hypothetical protein
MYYLFEKINGNYLKILDILLFLNIDDNHMNFINNILKLMYNKLGTNKYIELISFILLKNRYNRYALVRIKNIDMIKKYISKK